jgi:hypothetical protein
MSRKMSPGRHLRTRELRAPDQPWTCEAAVAEPPDHPMAVAMQWVARIFAAALMMFLPGVAGQWLDGKLGTGFIGPAGFVIGLVGGMMYLISATKAEAAQRSAKHKSTTRSKP